jgi:hypothetical protein
MARAKKRTPKVEEVRPYVEGVAKNLIDKLYGPDGPPGGTTLTALEDLVVELRDALAEKLLAEALARQAAAPGRPHDYRACPGCGAPLPCDGHNPRLLRTRAGEAAWQEPEGHCDRCRRAFFPSVQEPGHRPD